ncbi:hypothetical protein BSKO_13031 [Bryopsis sp. KO-2023]|nr:hypothetical protein BSKO_13031 [Bryopsis sp. KO-2023]
MGAAVTKCLNLSKGCTFCRIVQGDQPSTIVYRDDRVIAFNDRRPAAAGHYQVIPRKHIRSVDQIVCEDQPLVSHMHDVGLKILDDRHPGADALFGFHKPPFNSINHLHLHCIALPFNNGAKTCKYSKMGRFQLHWIPVDEFMVALSDTCKGNGQS